MKINNELYQRLFEQSQDNIKPIDYNTEFGFYRAVATGNPTEVEHYREMFMDYNQSISKSKSRSGVLSLNPLQNSKYHFANLMALIARCCVEAGLDRETSYTISDIYILKCDSCTTIAQINELQDNAINDYVKIMQQRRKDNIYSKQISKCIDYIHANLHEKLTLWGLASNLEVSPSYLSKLFTKEVGKPFSAYIKEQRLLTAANMLQYSNHSIAEISEYFHFSSQSHFTSSFQEYFNTTPKKYRDRYSSKSINKFE